MLMFFLTTLLLDKTKAENKVYVIQGNKNQNHLRGNGTTEEADSEG